jgi:RimJ/RimL family protein N-acetyltransferase
LRDGTPALIWPLLPTDARGLREAFRHLSPEARSQRFLSNLQDLDDAMLRRLVDAVDGVHHIALILVALLPEGDAEPVGVARLIQDVNDPAAAHIAITVADGWRRRGVGYALARALVDRRPAEIERLLADVAVDNRASLTLLTRLGRLTMRPSEMGVVEVVVDLAPNE